MIKAATLVAAAVTGAVAFATAPSASAAVRDYWVQAEPTTWNLVPNGRDAISGRSFEPGSTVFPTVVFRRYTRGWRRPLRNTPGSAGNQDLIPGPLIRARVGDRLRIHFRNRDTLFRREHSMHFHGVTYKPSSDGAHLPGFSGRDARVPVDGTWTYRLTAAKDSAGAWPYHDHSTAMDPSIDGGLYGMLSILGKRERAPDREFVVTFAPHGDFQTINERSFVGNTPVFKARVGELVQWNVMAMGSEHHTFHVHGHRWKTPGNITRDTQTVGPAESFRFRWIERSPGTWLYHCHVETHMAAGMIGIYRVTR